MDHGNEPAFPTRAEEYRAAAGGLTKREHIAALAMQGLLSERPNAYPDPTTVANWATAYADALLEGLAR